MKRLLNIILICMLLSGCAVYPYGGTVAVTNGNIAIAGTVYSHYPEPYYPPGNPVYYYPQGYYGPYPGRPSHRFVIPSNCYIERQVPYPYGQRYWSMYCKAP